MKGNAKEVFSIPSLMPMFLTIKDFVKKHQAKRGYIYTDCPGKDVIWALTLKGDSIQELQVKAIRVYNDILEVLLGDPDERMFSEQIKGRASTQWKNVLIDDELYFNPTIFNIANDILNYV